MSDDTDDPGSGGDRAPTVDARAAQGVQVGDHNTQFSARGNTVVQVGRVQALYVPGRRPRILAGRPWSPSDEDLGKAADDLADQVLDEWTKAVRDRELTDPIPVRWHWRRRPAAAPAEPDSSAPLPGFAVVDADTSDGTIKDLPDVYGGLPSGRAVVLGEAGSGKSDAAAWIAYRVLKTRKGLARDKRALFPVPILRTVTGWDRHRQSLGDWLAGELESEYAFLRRGIFGRSLVQRLMNSDRIAFFLDGFDEMAPESRTAALEQIDRRAHYRVVIFSRTKEFDEVCQRHLPDAAELTLAPLRPEDAAAYLRRYRRTHAPSIWDELIEHLDERPGGVLARALNSPLMLRLVRDALADRAAVRVLLEGRLTTPEQVHEHLLKRSVPLAYKPPPDASLVDYDQHRPQGWLSFLAAEMTEHGTYSLDWRQLPRWRRALPRIAVTTAVLMLVGAVGGALFYGPGGYAYYATRTNLQGMIPNTAGGMAIGLWLGLLLGPVVYISAQARMRGRSRRGIWRVNLGLAIVSGAFVVFANFGYIFKVLGANAPAVAVTMLVGLAIGTLVGWAAAFGHPPPGRTRGSRWKLRYARFPLLPGLVGGVALSFQYWYPNGIPGEIQLGAGLFNGIWATFITSLVIGAMRPHSPIDPVAGRSSDWRQEIARAVAYGAVFGILLGLGFGFREVFMWNAPGTTGWHKILPALWQTVGYAIPFGLGFGIIICDAWGPSLYFVQLACRRVFPVRGMRFLEHAYRQRVLRMEGSRYQFRHSLLQDTLAANVTPPAPVRSSRLRSSVIAIALLGLVAGTLWAATGDILLESFTEEMWAERVSDNAPVGRCIETESSWAANKNTVATTRCDEPHWGQVLGYPLLSTTPTPFPGDDQTYALAHFECGRLQAQYELPTGTYTVAYIGPRSWSWNPGTGLPQNYAPCVVHRTDNDSLTTDLLAAAHRPLPEDVAVSMMLNGASIYANAPAGTCVQTAPAPHPDLGGVAIVRCSQPHWAEVLGYPVLYRAGESPPDDNQAGAQAQAACRTLISPRALPPDRVLRSIRIVPSGYHPGTPLQDQVYVDCLAARG